MKKKSRRKKRSWKGPFFLILIGGVVLMVFSYRQELYDALRPWLQGKGVMTQKREVTLYFSDQENEYLIGEKRTILIRKDNEKEAEETLGELIHGPKGKLVPTLPPGTKLLGLNLDRRGLAKVNFNQAFTRGHPGGSSAEMMTVYSVVNSLALNFSGIKQVQFLVDGKPIESIAGHLSLKEPIRPKSDLIKRAGK